MADTSQPQTVVDEKGHRAETSSHSPTYSSLEAGPRAQTRPQSWKYRQISIGNWRLPWYASPHVQLIIVSFVCFFCPGMFNAINGMGGGGQVSAQASSDSNTALYSTFSVLGFFAGTICNKLGVKFSLSFGGIGYSLYIASYLSYNRNQNDGFIIFAGAWLGLCAGLLWTAQGAIMLSYPLESEKGRFISWFWMIFNLGAVIGSLIPLGLNINRNSDASVSDGTYIGFLILTLIGACLAWTLVNAKDVIRKDGSKVVLMKNPTWSSELLGLVETFKTDPYIIFLFPMFWASNWFYTYHFNDVNLAQFNTRTRALNGTLYWTMQIVGASVFGYALDIARFRRTMRAKGAWIALFVLTMTIWGGGFAFQRQYTRELVADPSYVKLDWTDSGYIGPMFLYMFYGFYDAAWQTCVYWFMGAMTNNGRKLANFAGFYKGIQSAGAAVMWRMDGLGIPYMNMFASCWALLGGSLLIALPVMIWKIKDHSSLDRDLEFSDETKEEVAGANDMPVAEQEKVDK